MMPAFGDELSEDEIGKVISHLRGFCTERGWPHGDLNMPRALATEKAFPENEAVITTTFARGTDKLTSEFLYEHRVGRRGQYEIFAQDVDEIGGAYKHVLFDSHRTGSIGRACARGGGIFRPRGRSCGAGAEAARRCAGPRVCETRANSG